MCLLELAAVTDDPALPSLLPVFSRDGEDQDFVASTTPNALLSARPFQQEARPLGDRYRRIVVLDDRQEYAAGAESEQPVRH